MVMITKSYVFTQWAGRRAGLAGQWGMAPVYAFLAIFSLAVHGANVPADCLVGFAASASGEGVDRDALVTATYRELFDQLGTGLTPAQLVEMAEAGNPFRVPAKAEKVDALGPRLRQFESLLAARDWNVPEVRA